MIQKIILWLEKIERRMDAAKRGWQIAKAKREIDRVGRSLHRSLTAKSKLRSTSIGYGVR